MQSTRLVLTKSLVFVFSEIGPKQHRTQAGDLGPVLECARGLYYVFLWGMYMSKIMGTVKWFNNTKGYGFISQPTGADVFVHYSSIEEKGYRTLREGEQVEFDVKLGPRGPQAEHVIRLEPQQSQAEV
jgi:cold shock protein